MKQLSKNTSTLLFIMLTGLLVVIAFISYSKIRQFNQSVNWVIHTQLVKTNLEAVASNLKDAETGQRGYLLSNDTIFLEPYTDAEKRIMPLLAALDSLSTDNAMQKEHLKKLEILVAERYEMLKKNLNLLKNRQPDIYTDAALLKGRNKMKEVQKQIKLMLQTEDTLLQQRTQVKDRSASITPFFLLALSLFSIFVITLFFFRLQKETSERISTTESNIRLQEARQQIEESEAKFRTLSETIPIMIWTATPDGKKNFFNQYFLDYTGLSFEELKGDGMLKIIHPDDLEKDLSLWQHSLKTGEDFKMEKRLRHHDGTYRWHLSHGVAQKDIQGNIIRWIGSSTDIHEQKTNAEEKFLLEFAEDFSHYKTGDEFFGSLVTYIANKTNIHYVFIGELTEKEKNIFTIKTIALVNRGTLVPNIEYPLPDGPCEQVIQGTVYNYPNQCRISFPKNQTLVQFNVEGYIGYPLFDNSGDAIGLVAVMHEKEISNPEYVSALLKIVAKRAEFEMERNAITLRLHIQNETFKQAEESSKQGSYSFNLTTGKLVYSDNLFRLIGYEPNEFEPSLEEFNMHVHPVDRDYVQQAAEKVLQNKTGDEWHYRMTTKTGNVINIKGTGRVIESGGEKLLVGTLQDVTKDVLIAGVLVEKEDYLNQIISNAPDAVIVINEKSVITLWNPKTEEIFGWKAEDVLGLNLTDTIIPPQYRPAHRDGMKRLLKTGEAQILNKTLELSALNKEGKEFPISITISQATQQGNKLFIAFLRDMTLEEHNKKELIVKSKQLEEINQTLALKNKDLENSNAELASFNYVASHDLQEPLRKIQAFSKRIIDKDAENLSDTAKDYFSRICGAAQRMQNLIQSLLDFSRTNLGEVFFEKTDLNQTLAEVKNVLYEIIKQKNAVIESQNLPIINAVPVQMQQLFLNIIGNSLKYSKDGVAPHIKITAAKVTINDITGGVKQSGPFWKIAISDNGIGFEQQYENKIFEVFQRLHGKTEYEGTGIGLAICKKIVQGHNGTITATAQLNAGATFTFLLPDNN